MVPFSYIIAEIDDWMYAIVLVTLLLACGVVFTIRTKGVQLRRIPDMFKYLLDKKVVKGKKSISSFQALMISTASRVGTGNIAGIATGIVLGGPGSVFWMWIMAIIGASSAFIESTLAQIWKRKGSDGSFRGGPAYYIEQGLQKRWLGIVFAIALLAAFGFGFNGLQAFNAASSLDFYFEGVCDLDTVHALTGLLLVLLTAFTIFGGMRIIGKVTSVLVPIMAITYILLCWISVFTNFDCLGTVFKVVMDNAFDFRAGLGGAAGAAILYGTKRGLLSNEAGMGSAPNAAAAASVTHPVKQGLIQSLSAYIDTFLVCTSSAFLVLVFYVASPEAASDLNGMPLVQASLQNSIGEIGMHFMTISIFFFAFSSLIGNYSYAEANFKFITTNRRALTIFRICVLIPIFLGSMADIAVAWSFADIFMGIMAIINILALFLLGKWAIAALKDYDQQKKEGKDPVFKSETIKGMPSTECWH